MASSRRGGAVVAAAAPRTPIDSSNGKASVTPAACRNFRRVGCRSVMSFAPERGALDDGMDQGTESVVVWTARSGDFLHGLAVGKLQGVPGPVHQQLFSQAPGELVGIFEDQFLEPVDVGELPSAGQFVGGLNPGPF